MYLAVAQASGCVVLIFVLLRDGHKNPGLLPEVFSGATQIP